MDKIVNDYWMAAQEPEREEMLKSVGLDTSMGNSDLEQIHATIADADKATALTNEITQRARNKARLA